MESARFSNLSQAENIHYLDLEVWTYVSAYRPHFAKTLYCWILKAHFAREIYELSSLQAKAVARKPRDVQRSPGTGTEDSLHLIL